MDNKEAGSEMLPVTHHTFRVLDKLLKVRVAEFKLGDTICEVVDVATHRYSEDQDGFLPSTVADINWSLGGRDNNEGVIVHEGDTFRFRTLGNSPIMVVCRNRHRWDASEMIALTREDLMVILADEGFPKPWMVFATPRIFPSTIRLASEVMYDSQGSRIIMETSSVLDRLASGGEVSIKEQDTIIDILKEMGKEKRYMNLNIGRKIYHRQVIHLVADFINRVFFEAGVVLLRKCDKPPREHDVTYMGSQGDLYHDLKLQVDRQAAFSGGQFETGWSKWFKQQGIDYVN